MSTYELDLADKAMDQGSVYHESVRKLVIDYKRKDHEIASLLTLVEELANEFMEANNEGRFRYYKNSLAEGVNRSIENLKELTPCPQYRNSRPK